jgi:hypothetical protein
MELSNKPFLTPELPKLLNISVTTFLVSILLEYVGVRRAVPRDTFL